jgi:hypothetical protein
MRSKYLMAIGYLPYGITPTSDRLNTILEPNTQSQVAHCSEGAKHSPKYYCL